MRHAARLGLTGALTDEISDCDFEIFRRARLRQNGIAPGTARAPRIGRERGVSRDRNHRHVLGPGILPQPAGQLEPVDPRDVKVGHDYVWARIQCPLERLQPVVCLIDTKSGIRQPIRVHAATVLIILDEEHDWA
jgi:hypothetical protein